MKFIKEFKDLGKNDADIAGGKGASLGEMISAGIPVPPGFVVLAPAFEQFLEESEIKADVESVLKKVNPKDINSVENASGEIQAMILSCKISEDIESEIKKEFSSLNAEFVAVRSSATAEDSSSASWAGELESYLNTTKETLLENVKKCWASLFTPRAIFYRFEKNMHEEFVSVAVVVQKMIQSEISGICFTVHPVTEDKNQMVIEAGWGLGEAIVGGMITPDNYVIDKSKVTPRRSSSSAGSEIASRAISERYISEQEMMIVRGKNGTEEKAVADGKREVQKLSDEKIIELAEICIGIENHYKFPCDIEWALENSTLYIVQSRPITTLSG